MKDKKGGLYVKPIRKGAQENDNMEIYRSEYV